jgi:hypothetical protein
MEILANGQIGSNTFDVAKNNLIFCEILDALDVLKIPDIESPSKQGFFFVLRESLIYLIVHDCDFELFPVAILNRQG